MPPPAWSDVRVTRDKVVQIGPTRRRFLTWTGVAAGLAFVPGLCTADDFSGAYPPHRGGVFALGVASGDPLPDGIVLWTRLAADPLARGAGMGDRQVPVEWELATDERMRTIVRRGTATATADDGHSVHIDVRGLHPATEYFYRFRADGEVSEVGRTRTAPAADARPALLTVATASCHAWGDGHFAAYRDMATHAPDVVLHLGDYIYEKPIPSSGGRRNDRRLPRSATREAITLEDYRERYALYKLDPNLQRAHRTSPFVTIFDDHEVDNNWAASIPEDAQPVPDFLRRRAAALRAWWENNPVRVAQRPAGTDIRAYRRLAFGDLALFHLLDTRSFRDDQVNGDNDTGQNARTADPARTLCGATQERWLLDGLGAGRRRWNVLAHQLPMADLARQVGGTRAVSMDGWSGYEAARTRVLDGARERGATNLISLVGDIHCNVVSDLRSSYTRESPVIGAEFACTSISSGGDGTADDGNTRSLRAASPHVRFANGQRGYILNHIRRDRWEAEFRVADSILRPDAPLHRASLVTVPDARPEIDVV